MATDGKITVHVLNHEGGGYSKAVEVVQGTTVDQLVRTLVTSSPDNHKIHLNREHVDGGRVLQNNDRLTITPQKVAGANRKI